MSRESLFNFGLSGGIYFFNYEQTFKVSRLYFSVYGIS